MGTALVTLPDGKKARVTFDSQEQLDSTVDDLVKTHVSKQFRPGEVQRDISMAVPETLAHMASGLVGSAVGGVAGLARGAGAGAAALAIGKGLEAARDEFSREATETIENVGEAMTYQPRGRAGQALSGAIETPFRWLAGKSGEAGAYVAEKTGSPALGAATSTALQVAAPGAVLKGASLAYKAARAGIRGSAAEASGEVPRGTTPRQTQQEPPGAAQAGKTGQDTPKSGDEARAKAYADRIGLDWARLGAGTRAALTTIAKDSQALERLNPTAVKRQAHLESLRIPVAATRGQLERDPVQLRREAIASNTSEGEPIRETDIAANRDLQANLEVLRGRVGGLRGGLHEPVTEEGLPAATPSMRRETKTPTQVGESTQGASREKAKWSKKGYQALFKIARETEPDAVVPLKPVTDLLTQNPEIQHLGWVNAWLNKAAKAKGGPEGEAVELSDAKLAEVHDLRSKATDIARTGGKEGYYAGQVVSAIDKTMQAAPAGAKAWKAANDAFRRHQEEFKDQAIIRKLVSQKKGGADRALALEKTWKQIAPGPLEQLRQVKKTLLTGGTPATRTAGRAAWRDFRAETVNRILEDARNVTSADETERAILTEAALRRSMKQIPRENLKEILGPSAVRQLDAILRARRITTRSPVGGRTTQSGTVPNALVLFEKTLKHMESGGAALGAAAGVAGGPVGAGLGTLAGAAVGRFAKGKIISNIAKKSQITPLEQAVRDVERTSRARARRAAYETLEQSGPTLPLPPSQPLPIGQAIRPPDQP